MIVLLLLLESEVNAEPPGLVQSKRVAIVVIRIMLIQWSQVQTGTPNKNYEPYEVGIAFDNKPLGRRATGGVKRCWLELHLLTKRYIRPNRSSRLALHQVNPMNLPVGFSNMIDLDSWVKRKQDPWRDWFLVCSF
jgi:hypothetical protein